MKKIALSMALTASFALSGSAFAGAGQPGIPAHERAAHLIERFDQNGDDVLDAAELAQMIEAHHWRKMHAFKRLDRDGDGRVSPQEKQAAKQKKAQLKARFDQNSDGHLDDGEKAALKKHIASERFTEILSRFDSDGDGAISFAEVSQATDRHPGPRHLKRLQKADTNDDHVITRSEFEAAAATHHRHRTRHREMR